MMIDKKLDKEMVKFLKDKGYTGVAVDCFNYKSTECCLQGYESFKFEDGYILAKQCTAFYRYRFQKKYNAMMFDNE